MERSKRLIRDTLQTPGAPMLSRTALYEFIQSLYAEIIQHYPKPGICILYLLLHYIYYVLVTTILFIYTNVHQVLLTTS